MLCRVVSCRSTELDKQQQQQEGQGQGYQIRLHGWLATLDSCPGYAMLFVFGLALFSS